jgi:hypothetical protein
MATRRIGGRLFTLLQVQVVHRHGDRTPISPMVDKQFWRSVIPTVSSLTALAEGTVVSRDGDASAPHPAAGDGLFGTLSSRGVEQLHAIGERLRADHVPSLLPAHPDATSLRVSSTDFPRTIQSAQALLQGLYPLSTRSDPITIDVSLHDAMIPDPVPRTTHKQELLEQSVLNSAAVRSHAAAHEGMRLEYSEKLRGVLDPAAYTMNGVGAGDEVGAALSWNKIAEVLKCLHSCARGWHSNRTRPK